MGKSQQSDRHLVWSNHNLDLEEWREDLLEQHPDATESELYELMCDANDMILDFGRINLDIRMPQGILMIADLGLWNCRKTGCREIPSGKIKDCFYTSVDSIEWYVDREGDLRADAYHHDGVNHYLYRTYLESAPREQRRELKEKIRDGTATRKDIEAVTGPVGTEICRVFGWELQQEKPSRERGMEERT